MSTRTISRLCLVGGALLVAWGVFARASVWPWAYQPLMAGAALLGVAGLLLPRAGPRDVGLWMALLAVGLAGIVQILPIPISLVEALSPGTDAFLQRHAVGYALSKTLGNTSWHPLSISPPETGYALALFGSMSLLALGVSRMVSVQGALFLGRGIALVGLAVALTGIAQNATFDGRLLWIWPFRYEHRPFGTFVNKNNFAGWMALAIPLTVGVVAGLAQRAMARVDRDWRSRLLWLGTREASEAAVWAGAAIVMAVSQMLALSRSGIVALVFGMVVFGWMAIRRSRSRARSGLVVFVLVAALLLVVAWVGADRVVARFEDRAEASLAGRLGAWDDALTIIRNFPVVGTGWNTFGTAMLYYQSHDPANFWDRTHNDYLQMVSEGGVLTIVPFLVACFAIVRRIRTGLREDDPRSRSAWVRIGAVASLAAIGLQEVVEFSLQIPANTVLFAVALGIAVHRLPRQRRTTATLSDAHATPGAPPFPNA